MGWGGEEGAGGQVMHEGGVSVSVPVGVGVHVAVGVALGEDEAVALPLHHLAAQRLDGGLGPLPALAHLRHLLLGAAERADELRVDGGGGGGSRGGGGIR